MERIKQANEAPKLQSSSGNLMNGPEIPIPGFNRVDKKRVEKDVREILDIQDEEKPVILDIESVRVISPGKFEIDIVSLMNRRPIVFKVEEGKYIIDLDSTLPGKDD